jgi:FkbM family methyltransferase
MLSPLLDRMQRALSRSAVATRIAVKVRNQARGVVKYHLSDGHNPRSNGERWLIQLVAKPGSRFVDVGANVGDWSALWLEADPSPAAGLLIDPSREAVAALRRRFSGWPQLEVIEAGASDRPGTQVLFEEPAAGERSSFVNSNLPLTEARSCSVTTVATEVARRSIDQLDFLKVDVEGYDLHVLRGTADLLARQAVSFIQFEYNSEWALAGSTLAGAQSFLKGFGYALYLLKGNGLWELNYRRYEEFFAYSNFVSAAPDRQSLLAPCVRGTI